MTETSELKNIHRRKETEQIKFFLEALNNDFEEKFSKKDQTLKQSHKIDNLEQRDIFLEGTFDIVQRELSSITNTFGIMKNAIKDYKELFSEAEQKYRVLYENSPDLYRTINRDGVIINCNDTYAKTLGFTKDEVIGKSIFDHTPEEYMKKKRESYKNWRRTGNVKNERVWMMRKDGTAFPALLSATTLFDKNGEIMGSNTVIREITEIFEAKEKINQDKKQIQNQLKEIEKLSKTEDEFLTLISHELKTPLVPIKSYVDMLASEKFGSLTEVQKQKLDLIKDSSDSMLNLVSNLLDSHKLMQGQFKLDKKRYSLFKIVNNAIEKLKPIIESRGITIVLDLQSAVPCLCDAGRIEQVLLNLLLNALDFCPEKTGKIQIKLQRKNDVIEVIMKDNGIGIDKDNLEKIFQKFYQIDASTTREHGGTGLGLSVCKGIIECHGGKIWAELNPDVNTGAEFHFQLPLNN